MRAPHPERSDEMLLWEEPGVRLQEKEGCLPRKVGLQQINLFEVFDKELAGDLPLTKPKQH